MARGFSLIQSRRAALEAFPNHVLKLNYVGFESSDKKNTLFSAHSCNKTDCDLKVQHPSKIVAGLFFLACFTCYIVHLHSRLFICI